MFYLIHLEVGVISGERLFFLSMCLREKVRQSCSDESVNMRLIVFHQGGGARLSLYGVTAQPPRSLLCIAGESFLLCDGAHSALWWTNSNILSKHNSIFFFTEEWIYILVLKFW